VDETSIANIAFKVAEKWLYNLTKWRAEIEVMRETLKDHSGKITTGYSIGGGGSGGSISDGTSSRTETVLKAEEKLPRIESKVRMIEASIESLGDEQQRLIGLKYIKFWPNQNCWEHLRLSEREFYRERQQATGKIAEIMLNNDVFMAEVIARISREKQNGRNMAVI
jgi:hypothetical protein